MPQEDRMPPVISCAKGDYTRESDMAEIVLHEADGGKQRITINGDALAALFHTVSHLMCLRSPLPGNTDPDRPIHGIEQYTMQRPANSNALLMTLRTTTGASLDFLVGNTPDPRFLQTVMALYTGSVAGAEPEQIPPGAKGN
jgi:hypothetical protein